MSLQRADARFLLPERVTSAAVLGDLDGWREALAELGVGLDGESAELVVAPAARAAEAGAVGARTVILEGRSGARQLRRAGYAVARYLPLPSVERADVLLPLEQRRAAHYAIREWTVPVTRLKQWRNAAVEVLISIGAMPALRPLVTVGTREQAPPFLLAGAAGAGVPPDAEWFLVVGGGDALSRGAYLIFPPGAAAPRWVLKFARVPDYDAPFEAERIGVALARSLIPEHVPEPLGRGQTAGLHWSLERAAVGKRLVSYLHSRASRESKAAAIERLAGWCVDVQGRTAAPHETLATTLAELEREIVPAFRASGADASLVAAIAGVPAVVEHGDLGTWNIVVQGDDFVVLDWEDARRDGLPLWDLWYVLADALAHFDGADGFDARKEHLLQLFRGELESSAVLFRWTRKAAEALGIRDEAVGALATLCWLRHAYGRVLRQSSLEEHATTVERELAVSQFIAEDWLSDPALGPGWSRWREPR